MKNKLQWYWWVLGAALSIGGVGYAASSFVGRVATKDEIQAIDDKNTQENNQTKEKLNKIDKKVDRIEVIQDRVDSRQTQIETKIDWLIHDRIEERH